MNMKSFLKSNVELENIEILDDTTEFTHCNQYLSSSLGHGYGAL